MQSGNILRNGFDLTGVKHIPELLHESFPETELKMGDVLLTKTGRINTKNSSLGRPALYDPSIGRVNISSEIYIIRLKEEVFPEYLLYVLLSEQYRYNIRKASVGSTDKCHLYKTDLENMLIPVPPLKIQKDIATYLGDKCSIIESLIAINKRRLERLDDIVKSRFIEMFGTFTEPKYGMVKVGELVTKDIKKVGKTYSPDDSIRYIDISSIEKGTKTIESTTDYVVKEAPSRAQQCVAKGDILFSNVRPNLKTVAMVDLEGDDLVCSSGFTVLRCEESEPEYLMIAITDDTFTGLMVRKETGSNYPAVSSKDVLGASIPAAPRDCQRTFASFVQQVDKSRFALKSRLEELSLKLEELEQSLIHDYVFGRLEI